MRIRRQRYASDREKTWVRHQASTDQKCNAQQDSGRSEEGREKTEEKRYFFLTYSGHGGQVPNTGNDFEPDGFDETWCLYDGELIDDELYTALGSFAAGVRVFVLSDSCHSGTVLKALREARFAALGMTPGRPRMMPRDIALRVYMEHEQFYDKLQQRGKDPRTTMRATGLLISGRQDNQTSSDGDRNGLFTETLLAVWKSGK